MQKIPFKRSGPISGLTLIEIIIVIVVIGILVTLGTVNYAPHKERALDREAQANLKLILAAERIYRMEIGVFYDSGTTQPTAITNINTNLRLLVSTAVNRSWDYITTATAGSACCGQATRTVGARTWRMRNTEDSPVASAACP